MKQNTGIFKGIPRISGYHVQVLIGHWHVTENTSRRIHCVDWPRWHLIYTVSGKAKMAWPGGEIMMLPQTAMLMAANTEYAYKIDSTAEYWDQYSMVFLPRVYWYDWLDWPEVAPGIMSLQIPEESCRDVERTFTTACDIASTPHLHWEDFAMAAAELVLLEFDTYNKQPGSQRHNIPPLQQAITFIEKNHSREISCEDIAQSANISTSHLTSLFRKHLNTSPLSYLNTLRVNNAQRMLRETDQPVAQIADLCGFNSAAYFCDCFRKLTGYTPGAYRKRMK